MATARGDIATIVRLVANTSALKPADYITKTVGNIMFMYYGYVKYFRVRPVDIDDLVDGLLFMMAQSYVEKQAIEGAKNANRAPSRQGMGR